MIRAFVISSCACMVRPVPRCSGAYRTGLREERIVQSPESRVEGRERDQTDESDERDSNLGVGEPLGTGLRTLYLNCSSTQ